MCSFTMCLHYLISKVPGHSLVLPSLNANVFVRIANQQVSGLKLGIALLEAMCWETFATVHIKINRKLSRQQRKQKQWYIKNGKYLRVWREGVLDLYTRIRIKKKFF